MGTIFNMTLIHFRYTFTFVLGIYAMELVMKSLISAIAGHLHIPDFWCKLSIHESDDDTWESLNEFAKQYNRDNYRTNKLDYQARHGSSNGSDLVSRLGRFK